MKYTEPSCHSWAQKHKDQTCAMEKLKIKILRQVVNDLSANVDGTEEYIQNKLKEICKEKGNELK